jgi:hypothetical protein
MREEGVGSRERGRIVALAIRLELMSLVFTNPMQFSPYLSLVSLFNR